MEGGEVKLLERDVTKQVKDFLESRGWRGVRMQRTIVRGQFQTGEPGMADFLFVHYLSGKHLWIEFKRPGDGRVSPVQKDWQHAERSRGAHVWVVDNLDEFEGDYEEVFGR